MSARHRRRRGGLHVFLERFLALGLLAALAGLVAQPGGLEWPWETAATPSSTPTTPTTEDP